MILSASHVQAETISYQAITDFPKTNAGEVPFYVDQARHALAINAAVVSQRNRFAKAEVVFDGQPGVYQFTLIAIAENDGEADYRLSVNGDIVGLASNPEVLDDFAITRHKFADITVPAGAVLAVESLANSNGKIPENGEFAFARGRWKALELSTSADKVTLDPDVSISVGIDDHHPLVNEVFDVMVSVSNASSNNVATGVVVSGSLLEAALQLDNQSVCTLTVAGDSFDCPVAQIPPGETVDFSVSLRALVELTDASMVFRVSADQSDADESDNAAELTISTINVSRESPDDTPPGEAEVDVSPVVVGPGESGSDLAGNGADPLPTPSSNSSTVSSGSLSVFLLLGFATILVTRFDSIQAD